MPSLPIYELKNYMNNNIDKIQKYRFKSLTTFDYIDIQFQLLMMKLNVMKICVYIQEYY